MDHIHLLRTERLDPRPRLSRAQLAAETIREIRWWSPDDLRNSAATFSPRSPPDLLDRFRTDGPPTTPIEISGF